MLGKVILDLVFRSTTAAVNVRTGINQALLLDSGTYKSTSALNPAFGLSCLTSLISGLGSWDRSRELNQTCRVRMSIRGCPGRRCHCSPVCIFLGRAPSRPLGLVGLSVIEMVIGGPTALIKFESSSSGPSRITVLPKSCTTKKRCMT